MGKLGDHPNIVAIHDMGEIEGQPYIVIPFMSGGDVEELIEKSPDHRLPLEQAISEREDDQEGRLAHHSDRGAQFLSIRYTERMAEAGIEPSVGSSTLSSIFYPPVIKFFLLTSSASGNIATIL